MEAIQIRKDLFDDAFKTTLDKLKLDFKNDQSINVRLNDQVEVDRFINNLHRKFHYEVVSLQRKLEKL